MRVIFLGTPDFAVKPLENLIKYAKETGKIEIVSVVTNPDKPVGRKRILTACPVKQCAINHGLKVLQYDKISIEGVEDIKNLSPDLMITCAFGQILSQEIIDMAKLGIFNIHASLLPKYRGASPIHHAILNGEKETGVTIMKTELGIDTGDVILQESIKIGEKETCGELFDRLSVVGARLIIQAVEQLINGSITYIKQDEKLATLTKMLKKQDAEIDFSKSNVEVYNKVRAFNPAPVAYFVMYGEPYKVFAASLGNGKGMVGEILVSDKYLEIACGSGSIIVEKIQKAGGNQMNVADFLRGVKIEKGLVL